MRLPVAIRESVISRFPHGSLRARLAGGTLWTFIGTVGTRLFALLAGIVVARMIGQVAFGRLGIVQSTLGMLQVLAGFGLGLTVTKYIAEFRRPNPAKVGQIIALATAAVWVSGLASTACLLLGANFLATSMLGDAEMTSYLQQCAPLLALLAISGVQAGVLSGFELFRQLAIVNCVAGIIGVPLSVIGVLLWGLSGAIYAMIGVAVLTIIMNEFVLRRYYREAGIVLDFSAWRDNCHVLYHFALPTFMSSLLLPPVQWGCNAMLVNQPEGYKEMGIFNAAGQWRTAILLIPNAAMSLVVPVLTDLRASKDYQRYRKVTRFNVTLNAGLSLVIAIPLIAGAPWIMGAYGPEFQNYGSVLVTLSASAVFYCAALGVANVIMATGRMWLGFTLNLIWAAILLALCHQLVSEGAIGLAIAYLTAYGIFLVLCALVAHFFLNEPT